MDRVSVVRSYFRGGAAPRAARSKECEKKAMEDRLRDYFCSNQGTKRSPAQIPLHVKALGYFFFFSLLLIVLLLRI